MQLYEKGKDMTVGRGLVILGAFVLIVFRPLGMAED